ncbi:hypothetical protein QFZ79_003776 [Arthrobacter sp. V4I6]|nr:MULTISPECIES: FAD-binding oxidoreductase [unclassified Arthrobacter]MDQ0821400.1 hypothetical protein [Arthrobacter sp. V1I7]MDQ0855665.1 hypothetical protein [Arthrobacter sp. V4I6]
MAGNAIGPGLVIDFSRHMARVLAIDEQSGVADVEPGVILSVLSGKVEQATGRRLTFAPDPSSKNRATVGGSVANDACGNHSVRYGRMSDHVAELDVVTSDGARLTATSTGLCATDPEDRPSAVRAESLNAALRDLAHGHLAEFRTELGRIQRQVSGYHLANLLPEKGFNVRLNYSTTERTGRLSSSSPAAPRPCARTLRNLFPPSRPGGWRHGCAALPPMWGNSRPQDGSHPRGPGAVRGCAPDPLP